MNQSSIQDTDLIILSLLEDIDLENVCEANQSTHNLCLYPDLWITKIKSLYYDFPYLDVDGKEYKALYYKLKYNQWTDIVVWSEHNKMKELSQWIVHQKTYENFYILHAKYLMNNIKKVNHNKKKILAIELFKFIYTHRLILNTTLKMKGFKMVILNKLDEYASTELYYKEIFDLFKMHIQNN